MNKNYKKGNIELLLNQRGITMVSLAITIIIMIILGTITVYTGNSVIKQAKLQNINTNMMLIQAKTKTIEEQAKFNEDTSGYKGTLISDITGNEKIENLIANNVITDEEKEFCYLLDQSNLNEMGLEKIDIEDGYIVNYDTNEIIYVKGFEANNQKYYKLSEMKNLELDVDTE